MSDCRQVVVLYGSQTGNGESIAKEVHENLRVVHADAQFHCMPLNKFKTFSRTAEVTYLLLIVCSTTGNGDTPENADAWWRSVKLRSAAKDMFANTKFAVLGLGDTNYDKFCFVGKAIDKRLGELGGERVAPIVCADEATNLEESVEKWKKTVSTATREFLHAAAAAAVAPAAAEPVASPAKPCNGAPASIPTPDKAAIPAAVQSVTEGVRELQVSATPSPCAQQPQTPQDFFLLNEARLEELCSVVPAVNMLEEVVGAGASSMEEVRRLSQLANAAQTTSSRIRAERAAKDKSKLVRLEVLPQSEVSSEVRQALRRSSWSLRTDESCCCEHPFHAPVTQARWLTDPASSTAALRAETAEGEWGAHKRVVEVTVSLQGSGVEYAPGDSLGVLVPNPPWAVQLVLDRLNQSRDAAQQEERTRESVLRISKPRAQSAVGALLGAAAVAGDDEQAAEDVECLTLGEYLQYRVDLCGLPKKAQVSALAALCADAAEAAPWTALASATKDPALKQLWTQVVETQKLGMALVLHLLRSCRVGVSELAALLLPLVPRYYSIASSPLFCGSGLTARFALSLVRYSCPLPADKGRSSARSGVASLHLEHLLRHALYQSSAAQSAQPLRLRLFHKSTPAFHLPSSLATPLILVGPGTGVAPFLGFLQHRAMLQRRLQPPKPHDPSVAAAPEGASAAELAAFVRSPSGGLRRAPISVSQLMQGGVWRGGVDLEDWDLPREHTAVERFLVEHGVGEVHLFFGCRNDLDCLYSDELRQFEQLGVLSSYAVAQSRVCGADKVYVQHQIRARGLELARLLLHKQASVYICGDGLRMAKDVMAVLAEVLVAHHAAVLAETAASPSPVSTPPGAPAGLSSSASLSNLQELCKDEASAAQFLQTLKTRRRLCLDIWS